ncbi:MAG TPA: penicillin-binding transpeptidase domain-containing protein, partial [Alphaproteobacteria bacterium]|nr:penicillin-binding transpeptidase domain-containing protein [Alphaproteobacteria bacterium]
AARRLGITAPLTPHPSLALGVAEVSLLELTGAYAVVASGGLGVVPHAIAEIRDRKGTMLYRRAGSGPGQVLAPDVAAGLDALLRAVVREGTGRRAALNVPAAGKTGTSQDSRDAWFLGYRDGLVAGVWLGNDDGTPMKGVTGGTLPASLWHDFMTRL